MLRPYRCTRTDSFTIPYSQNGFHIPHQVWNRSHQEIIMGLWQTTQIQGQVWKACRQLNAEDEAERWQAVEALQGYGDASIAALRFIIRRTSAPRSRIAAAVALHLLHDPVGMEILKQMLSGGPAIREDIEGYTLPRMPSELEAAFLRIGAPDAVTALIEAWDGIPKTARYSNVLAGICHIWAELRDPRALEPLTASAPQIPELFVSTVPAFGEMAVPPLERMSRHTFPQCRSIAVSTLKNIKTPRSFKALVPLLRDPVPEVRALVPEALQTINGLGASEAIKTAIDAGWSSGRAIKTLASLGCDSPLPFLAVVERWRPHPLSPPGDTEEAVIEAVDVLGQTMRRHEVMEAAVGMYGHALRRNAVIQPLFALLQRKPGVELTTLLVRVIGERKPSGDPLDTETRAALVPLLAHPLSQVRNAASHSLLQYGDPIGRQLAEWLEADLPRGSLLTKIHSVLRGGADAGQVATQAVEQVGKWFTRVSKEAAERKNIPSGAEASPKAASVPSYDPRLPELFRQLLGSTLAMLHYSTILEQIEELMATAVAAVRALEELEGSAGRCAVAELVRALHTVKYLDRTQLGTKPVGSGARVGERLEYGVRLRTAAADSLMELFGADSFAPLADALRSDQLPIVASSIAALRRLGDGRAVPLLQQVIAEPAHPCQQQALEALAEIRRQNPEMMTLLRGSSAHNAQPEMLLRPSYSDVGSSASNQLLRPAGQEDGT